MASPLCYLCFRLLRSHNEELDLPVCQKCFAVLRDMPVEKRMDLAIKVMHSRNIENLNRRLLAILELAADIGPRGFDWVSGDN